MDILILGHSYLQIQQHRKANIQVYAQRLSYYSAFFFLFTSIWGSWFSKKKLQDGNRSVLKRKLVKQ